MHRWLRAATAPRPRTFIYTSISMPCILPLWVSPWNRFMKRPRCRSWKRRVAVRCCCVPSARIPVMWDPLFKHFDHVLIVSTPCVSSGGWCFKIRAPCAAPCSFLRVDDKKKMNQSFLLLDKRVRKKKAVSILTTHPCTFTTIQDG